MARKPTNCDRYRPLLLEPMAQAEWKSLTTFHSSVTHYSDPYSVTTTMHAE